MKTTFVKLTEKIYKKAQDCETCHDEEWDENVIELYTLILKAHNLVKIDLESKPDLVKYIPEYSKIAKKIGVKVD